MINHYRAFEGRNTSASCPFIPKLLLTEPQDNEKYLPKVAPASVGFVHCEGSRGVSWVLNLSIISVWIYFRLVGLTMLSVGLRHAVSRQKPTQTRPQIVVSDKLKLVNIY